MKKTLVICMSRMGDILQSLAVFRAIKSSGNSKVSVLARSSFAGVLYGSGYVDEVIEFDTKNIVGLAINNDFNTYKKAVSSFIDKINEREFDEVINLTFSDASAYFMNLINAPVKKGLNISSEGALYNQGLWSNYFNGTVLNRTVNSLNLVDIFQNIAEVRISPKDLAIPESLLIGDDKFTGRVKEDDYVIMFQMGASQENKRWSVNSFVSLAKFIFNNDYYAGVNTKIVLVGSPSEATLGYDFLRSFGKSSKISDKIINLIGKTSINELWKVLSRANIFVTNDTGPMHMAASIGVPIVNISLGPVKFQETGPYSSRSLVVTPQLECYPCSFARNCLSQKCKLYIKPHDVFTAIQKLDGMVYGGINIEDSKAGSERLSLANLYYSKLSVRDKSPRAFEMVPLNKQTLKSQNLSEIICNTSIMKDLKFDKKSVPAIVEMIERYDSESFDFEGYYDSLSSSLTSLNKLVKEAITTLKRLSETYRSKSLSEVEKVSQLKVIANELLEKDVEIARHQEDNEVSRYLLGLFQSFKASNIGSLSDQIIENNRIYGYMLASIGVLKLLAFKINVSIDENRSRRVEKQSTIKENVHGDVLSV